MGFRWRVVFVSALLAMVLVPDVSPAASSSLVISQVYSSQDPHSRLKNDFVELLNIGTTDVSVTGWSVQVSPLTGGVWNAVTLSGTIAPGQYYLISGLSANGDPGLYPLPTANAAITTPLN